jgi:hypothetical protein
MGARLYFLTVMSKSQAIPGICLESTQVYASSASTFFFSRVSYAGRRALRWALPSPKEITDGSNKSYGRLADGVGELRRYRWIPLYLSAHTSTSVGSMDSHSDAMN